MVLTSKSSNITKITINYNGFAIQIIKNNKHDNYTIYSIFSFHLNNDEHVILYHKKYDENCLLLCKINKIYKNIIIPCNNNIIYDKDIVATYL